MVIDGTPIGRIYADRLPSGEKWLWFLHILRATPNQGIADTLEDAKAALADSYRRHAVTCGNRNEKSQCLLGFVASAESPIGLAGRRAGPSPARTTPGLRRSTVSGVRA